MIWISDVACLVVMVITVALIGLIAWLICT
jgi:hypothetical protein